MRTRLLVTGLLLAGIVLGPALPAQAHASFAITGGPAGQYLYYDDGIAGGHAGYLSVPLSDPVALGSSPSTDGFGSVMNVDAVPHSMTHCTSGCESATPGSGGGLFNVDVPPGASVSLAALDNLVQSGALSGTVVFYCTVHPWMRGEVAVST